MRLHSPKTHPNDYGATTGDYHLVANAQTGTVKCFQFGKPGLLWERPILLVGQVDEWWVNSGNTPPGVWYLGELHNDRANGTMEPGYGWMFFDMVDCEGREDGNGRSGLGIHGGGSALPDPYAPYQLLIPTLGCPRMHNRDLLDYALPIYQKSLEARGKVWLSVHQLGA